MKKNLLLTFLIMTTGIILAQQPVKKKTKTTQQIPNEAPSTKRVVKPKAKLKEPLIPEKKNNDTIVKPIVKPVEEQKPEPLPVYVADTTRKFLKGNVKVGDDYINSRYIPNTITVLFANDYFFQKQSKDQAFLGDKVELNEKYYTNQEALTNTDKKKILESLHEYVTTRLSKEFYSKKGQIPIKKDFDWTDTTLSIDRHQYLEKEKLIKNVLKEKLGKSLAGKHLNTKDSLGLGIRDLLLKNDIASQTMKVWLDPKYVLRKSKEAMTIGDMRNSIDPKKRIVYQSLLKQNYILVMGIFNVHELINIEYTTDRKGNRVEVSREYTGNVVGDVRCYLYKIQMNPVLIDNLATSGKTKGIPLEYKYRIFFNDLSIPTSFFYDEFKKKSRPIDPERFKQTVFMTNAFSETSTKIIEELEKQIDEFKMRSAVMQVKPYFAAEMGTKQGAYIDQKYGVYRYEKDITKNEVNAVKVANVRMTKIAMNSEKDNSVKTPEKIITTVNTNTISNKVNKMNLLKKTNVATQKRSSEEANKEQIEKGVLLASNMITQPPTKSIKDSVNKGADSLHRWSHFKPISVGKIEDGDFLLQEDDRGASLLIGTGKNGLFSTLSLGAEFSISQLAKGLPRFPSGLRLGIMLNLITNEYRFKSKEGEDVSSMFMFYLAKEFYLTPIVDVRPYLGYESSGKRDGIRFGIGIPVNLYQGRYKLIPEVSLQTLPEEGSKVTIGANFKFDF